MTVQINPRIRSVGNGEVRDRTGLGLFEWQGALDAWNADNRSVRAAIGHLKHKYGLTHFWAQVIATRCMLERVSQ